MLQQTRHRTQISNYPFGGHMSSQNGRQEAGEEKKTEGMCVVC